MLRYEPRRTVGSLILSGSAALPRGRGTADSSPIPVSSPVHNLSQRSDTVRCQPRVRAARDHPDELDPSPLVLRQMVPRSRCRSRGQREDRCVVVRAHLPKMPRSVARDLAVMRGSLLSDASRNSCSQPRSFSVAGVPKMSVIAFAAVAPTAWSRARRIR